MAAILGEVIYGILRFLLPWLCSGEEKTSVESHAGLEGMDRKGKPLSAGDLPILIALACVLALPGCMGTVVEHHYHLVEPGGVVEVVEGKVKVRSAGTSDVGEYDPVGKVLMPKSVYEELRAAWLKEHPEASGK